MLKNSLYYHQIYINKFLNNPQYQHYPHIIKPLCCSISFGQTLSYTLISPLFQSIPLLNPQLLISLLENFYTTEEIRREEKRTIEEERAKEWIFELSDLYAYLTFKIQSSCKKLIFTDKLTGEILFEIPLTKQNLNKKIEELLPSSFSFNSLEVYSK